MKAALVIIVMIAVSYFPAVFQQKTFFLGDNYALMVPGKLFSAAALKEGRLPFWNPHILSGQPFLADINQSVLYPSTLLFMVLPTWLAVNSTVLLHFFIGTFGIYAVVKKKTTPMWLALVSAAVWVFSSQVVSSGNNLASVQTTAWLPWIYLHLREMLEKNRPQAAFFFAVTLILGVLGGHPQPLMYMAIFCALYVALYPKLSFSEKVQRFRLPLVLALGVLSVVLIPFIELSGLSTRVQMTAETVLSGSLHPAQLATWFVPNIFTNLSSGLVWGPAWQSIFSDTGYITFTCLAAILLLIRSKKSYEERFFLWAAGISIVIALGRFFPFATMLYDLIPSLRLFRNPVNVLWIWTFCAAVLVPPALMKMVAFTKKLHKVLPYAYACSAAVIIIAISQILWFLPLWNGVDSLMNLALTGSAFHTPQRDFEILHWILRNLTLVVLSTSLVVIAITRLRKPWVAVCLILVAELFLAVRPSIMLAPTSVYDLSSGQEEYLKQHLQPGERYISSTGYLPWSGFPTYWENIAVRPPFQDSQFTAEEAHTFEKLSSRRANLGSNWGQVTHLPTPFGISTFVLARNADYWKTAASSTNINEVDAPGLLDPRISDQSVRFFLLDTTIYSTAYLEALYTSGISRVYVTDGFAVYEFPQAAPFMQAEDSVEVSLVRLEENVLAFTVASATVSATTVQLSQQYYPGWRCSSSDGSCTVSEGSRGMDIKINAKNAEVTLHFEPTGWRFLLTVSLISSLGLLSFGIRALRTSRVPQAR